MLFFIFERQLKYGAVPLKKPKNWVARSCNAYLIITNEYTCWQCGCVMGAMSSQKHLSLMIQQILYLKQFTSWVGGENLFQIRAGLFSLTRQLTEMEQC